MVVVVLLAQVVHVGGRDQRAAHLGREAADRLVDLLLLGEPVALDLEVHVLGPEHLHQLVEVRARLGGLALQDPLARTRRQAAGEADHAVGVAGEQLEVDARLAAVQPFEEPGAGQLDEVAQPLVVLREQRQVVALDLAVARPVVVDEVRLEADDRLDPVLLGRLVELDRAVHHAVIGEPERGLPEARRALGELVDLARAVEQRVLGVDVEMGAAGSGHGSASVWVREDGTVLTRRSVRQ